MKSADVIVYRMVSPGGRDGPSDNRGPAHMDKMKKTAPPKTRRSLPAYLNRNHPNASNQEPSTPPTSLHGPNTLPLGPPPSHQMAPPTSVLGLFDAAGGSPFVGSSNVAEGSPAARSSNVADGSTAVANSVTGGGSHTAANSVTSGVSPAAGNSSSSTNTAAPRRQAPRRRATLEAPRDESGRFVVVLSSDYKIIDNHLATVISNIFEEYPQVAAYTYKSISKDVINQYWEEFQKKCVWNRSSYSNNVMKGAFIDKLKNRYKGILNDVRKAERQPVWCPDDVWQSWARMWSSPEFKRRSARAKKARGGKDGVPKGTHTGGSCSHAKTAKKLEKK
ncbi:uncharacterized protein [Euphorbia lathyris]|uniref:uncharacterized protein isoform X5 n=1 Tax=Euphorbia lathyris TaxID=212925 RepID=UPI0033134F7D